MPKRAAKSEEPIPATSSVPDTLPAKQEALFREVLTLFEKERLPYAVAGASALRQHTGICRFTKDLDVFLSARDATAALRLLEANGFECEVRDPVWLAKAHHNDFFVDLITGMSNGVVAVDASWIKRAQSAYQCSGEEALRVTDGLLRQSLCELLPPPIFILCRRTKACCTINCNMCAMMPTCWCWPAI